MRKVVLGLIILFSLTACMNSKIDKEQALAFKTEYESLNGLSNTSGKEYRTVSISEENPFVKTTAEDIVKKIDNSETFYLYVGDKLCPWCRSVIEKAASIAMENEIYTIYYVDIWDDEGNEILRDKYTENADGTFTKVKEGTEAYYKLLAYFDEYLKEYTINDKSVGEKRIYAPNFFYVKNGKLERFTTARSDKQEDSRDELTKEILKDEEEKLLLFYLGDSCDIGGC